MVGRCTREYSATAKLRRAGTERATQHISSHCTHRHTHTRTHQLNGPLSGTTRVSQYQKGRTNMKQETVSGSGHMQVCISLQTDNHASTPPLSFFTGRMPFLPPNQQRQSTEGNSSQCTYVRTHAHTHTNTHNRLTALFPGLPG